MPFQVIVGGQVSGEVVCQINKEYSSGLYVIAETTPSGGGQISGAVQVSGTVSVASGVFFASGIGVVTAGAGGGQVSGAVMVSGDVNTSISGNAVWISGGVTVVGVPITSGSVIVSGTINVASGLVAVLSGQIIAKVSGETIIVQGTQVSGAVIISGTVTTSVSGNILTVASGVQIAVPLSGLIIAGTNPLTATVNSGGSILTSGECRTVMLKALASNSSDLYIGGHDVGQRPYSGFGFVLTAGEIVPLGVPNVGYVRVCSTRDGDKVAYIGV